MHIRMTYSRTNGLPPIVDNRYEMRFLQPSGEIRKGFETGLLQKAFLTFENGSTIHFQTLENAEAEDRAKEEATPTEAEPSVPVMPEKLTALCKHCGSGISRTYSWASEFRSIWVHNSSGLQKCSRPDVPPGLYDSSTPVQEPVVPVATPKPAASQTAICENCGIVVYLEHPGKDEWVHAFNGRVECLASYLQKG